MNKNGSDPHDHSKSETSGSSELTTNFMTAAGSLGVYNPGIPHLPSSMPAVARKYLENTFVVNTFIYRSGCGDVFASGPSTYIRHDGKTKKITSFAVANVAEYRDGCVKFTFDCVLSRDCAVRVTVNSSDFLSPKTLNRRLASQNSSLKFLGTEEQAIAFGEYLANMPNKSEVSQVVGLVRLKNDDCVFATQDKVVDRDGSISNDVFFIRENCPIKTDILKFDTIWPNDMQELGKHLFKFNQPNRTLPILSWAAAAWLSSLFSECKIKTPILFLMGEAGSGKSSTAEQLLVPLFGIPSGEGIVGANELTKASLARCLTASNTIPVIIDEFKNLATNDLNDFTSSLRNLYDHHTGMHASGKDAVYYKQLTSPLVVLGEYGINEPAINERSIRVIFSKKDLSEPSCADAFRYLKKNSSLISSYGRSLLQAAMCTDEKECSEWFDEGMKQIPEELPGRIKNNIAVCICGLRLMDKHTFFLGLSWDEVYPISFNECVRQVIESQRQYLLDDSESGTSVFTNALSVMSRMHLVPGEDYFFEDGEDRLIIRSSLYDEMLRYHRANHLEEEVLSRIDFWNQFKYSELYVQHNVTRRFAGQPKKAFIVKYPVLKKSCDVSGFELP